MKIHITSDTEFQFELIDILDKQLPEIEVHCYAQKSIDALAFTDLILHAVSASSVLIKLFRLIYGLSCKRTKTKPRRKNRKIEMKIIDEDREITVSIKKKRTVEKKKS